MAKLMNLSLALGVEHIKVCSDTYKLIKGHKSCKCVDGLLYYKGWRIIQDITGSDLQIVFKPEVKEISVVYK